MIVKRGIVRLEARVQQQQDIDTTRGPKGKEVHIVCRHFWNCSKGKFGIEFGVLRYIWLDIIVGTFFRSANV